jgi:hypothetical protein
MISRNAMIAVAALFWCSQSYTANEPQLDFVERSKVDGICEPIIMSEMEINLSNQFCLVYGSFKDSVQMISTWKEIAALLAEWDSSWSKSAPRFGPIFAIRDIPEIIFFLLPSSDYPMRYASVAYNALQKKYYILNDIDTKGVSSLLGTMKNEPKWDGEILRFCRLIAILRNPGDNIAFISSINELITAAVMRTVATTDLAGAESYKNIKVDLPSISRSEESTEVKFYFAKSRDIIQATFKLKGIKLLDYSENTVGNMPHWYPYLRYLYH